MKMNTKQILWAFLVLAGCSGKPAVPPATADSTVAAKPDTVAVPADTLSDLNQQTDAAEARVNDLLKGL